MLGIRTGRQIEPALRPSAVQTAGIVCYHCGRVSSVSVRALSASCEHCRKSLDLNDLSIKGHHWGGVLCTCGRLTVGRKARVTAKMAVASLGVDILGQFQGLVVCGGAVTIGSRARFVGAVWAPSLHIEEGAIVEGGPFVVPCDPLGQVEINAARGGVPRAPMLRGAG
jgi:cytoskeletal protein CcmA (bactofilin family)